MGSCRAPQPLQYQKGSYMIWIIILIPVLIATLAFSVDIGQYHDDTSQAQTVADSAARAGINVVRRVFDEDTSKMSAICKAGFISEAVDDALTRMAASIDAGGMGFTVDGVELIYCPRSSEQLIIEEGPCYVIPAGAGCDADCDCAEFSDSIDTYVNDDTDGKPGFGFYPMENELAEGGGDSVAYFSVQVRKTPRSYFLELLPSVNFPQVTVSAIARASKKGDELPSCPAYYNPWGDDNDPQLVRLKDSSSLEIKKGGMLLLDNPNNVFNLVGKGNTIKADWVAVRENATIGKSLLEILTCSDPSFSCPIITGSEWLHGNPKPPDFIAKKCDIYPDTSDNICDNPAPGLYINCVINETNYKSVVLTAGTYCGGLTINNVGTESVPYVLEPLRKSDEISDDVYFFTGKPAVSGDYKKAPTSTGGGLIINNSYVEAGSAGIEGAGIYLYAPILNASSDFNLNLLSSTLIGSARTYIDHLSLDHSELIISPYHGAGNFCEPGSESSIRIWLVQ